MPTPKKPTSTKSATTKTPAKKTTAKSSTTTRRKPTPQQPQQDGLPRYAWGGIWLLVGLLELFALFGGQQGSLHFIRDMFLSLIGKGWYLLPFCTLALGGLLLLRRKGPVRLQGAGLLTLPWLFGCLVHGVFCRGDFSDASTVLGDLLTTGKEGSSGGLFSGGVFELLNSATPAFLVVILLLLLFFGNLLVVARITPRTLWAALRKPDSFDYDSEEEQEHYEKPRELPNIHQVAAEKRQATAEKKQKQNFDIRLEGEPVRPTIEPIDPPDHMKKSPMDFLRKRKDAIPGIDPSIVSGDAVGVDIVSTVEADQVQTMDSTADHPNLNRTTMGNPFEEKVAENADPFADILNLINKHQTPQPETPMHKQHAPVKTTATADFDLTRDLPNAPAMDGVLGKAKVYSQSSTLSETDTATSADPFDDVPWDEPISVAKEAPKTDAEQMADEISANAQAPVATYLFPPSELLNRPKMTSQKGVQAELAAYSERLVDTLQSFGVTAEIIGIVRGPSVTRFEVTINRGVKFSRITSLSDDIALSLGAVSVRIAPIPDKLAIGIEVPNKAVTMVTIREVLESRAFCTAKSQVSFAVGKDITGAPIIGDIGKMPHLLIAGTTGSGKSVCINSLLISILYKATPAEVRLIMVDPKMVELGNYNGVPHLLIPVVTDPQKAAGALNWAVGEMERRYKCFADNQVRNLVGYNEVMERRRKEAMQTEGGTPDVYQPLPEIVIVIDELADLMMVAAKDVETSICRIAQKARAAGMYLVVATQRPSADVITGLMKANIPSRIAFAVASQMESRIILDSTGAEKLIGKGDMLYAPLGEGKPKRVQGCFISSDEIETVIAKVKEGAVAEYSEEILEHIERRAQGENSGGGGSGDPSEDEDEMLWEAVEVVMEARQASTSMLQRRLKLGYARAARIVDQMEDRGIVGGSEGSKPRQLLITRDEWQEIKARRSY